MSDINLVRLSQERIIPYFDKRIISNTEQKMTIMFKVNRIKPVPVQSLHFDFDSHLHNIISSYWGILKNDPKFLFIELKLFDNFSSEYFSTELQASQLPQINMCSTIANDGNGFWIFREARVLIFAGDLTWKMLDGLMRV